MKVWPIGVHGALAICLYLPLLLLCGATLSVAFRSAFKVVVAKWEFTNNMRVEGGR